MAEPTLRTDEPLSRQTLIALLATLPTPLALCDSRLQWLSANDAWRRLAQDADGSRSLARLHDADLIRLLVPATDGAPQVRRLRLPPADRAPGNDRRVLPLILDLARVDSVDAGPLWWISARPAPPDDSRTRPIADHDAYRLMFHEAVVPMTLQDASYRFIDVNEPFCRYSGYPREALIGADPLDLFDMHPKSRDEARTARAQMDWTGVVPYRVEDRRSVRPDGRERRYDLIGRPTMGSSGEPVVYNTLIDITDLKRTQERLQQQLHWFETMLTTTSAGVAVLAEGRFVRVNRQFERLTGRDALELQGASPAPLFGGDDDWSMLQTRIDRARAGGTAFVEEVTLTRRDGEPRLCELHVGWIASQVGREAILTLHDISRLKRVESQRLQEVRSQRDLVIREVHHRIKNNLQGVAGLLQQVAVRKPEAAGALSDVANQIASIAQVYGLKVREQERLAFADLLEAVLASLGRTTGVAFELRIAPAVLTRRGWLNETDAVPIALVISEIATNAIKHRTAGGALRASLDLEDEAFCVRISNPGRLADAAALSRTDASVFGLGLIKAMLPRRGACFELTEEAGRVTARVSLSPPALDLAPV